MSAAFFIRQMVRSGGCMVACAALGLALTATSVRAQHAEATEASVKAAFLYKFAAYVEWPAASFASDESPFVIAHFTLEKLQLYFLFSSKASIRHMNEVIQSRSATTSLDRICGGAPI